MNIISWQDTGEGYGENKALINIIRYNKESNRHKHYLIWVGRIKLYFWVHRWLGSLTTPRRTLLCWGDFRE